MPANHLVVVCCHGIWTGNGSTELGFDESEWLIADFQAGETPTFIEHIKAGLRELAADEAALLVFSGSVGTDWGSRRLRDEMPSGLTVGINDSS